MIVSNVRFGFATNSSSSHSIVVMPPGTHVEDDDVEQGMFGWNFFTAASRKSKRVYAACLLKSALYSILPDHVASKIVSALYPEWDEDSYVDHQSLLAIPFAYGSRFPDLAYADELAAFLSRTDVVILGGNDNTDMEHPLSGIGKQAPTGAPPEGGSWVCRKNPRGDWTLFNLGNGLRIRVAFQATHPGIADAPELVDVKLTDYCPFGCPMCYEDSTHGGKHAPLGKVSELAAVLSEQQVFEVSIGGGEPTLMPTFRESVETLSKAGMVVNFTTRNHKWLHENRWWRDECGAVGVSLDTSGGNAHAAFPLLRPLIADGAKIVAHIVPGMFSDYTVSSLLRSAHGIGLPVLLLGWKHAGRADTKPPMNGEDKLEDVLSKLGAECPKLSFDTVLADKMYAKGAMEDVPKWMYDTHDGVSSCYVDLVAMRCGPSSYGKLVPYDGLHLPKMVPK